MCELLGLTSNKKIRMNELLEIFFSHSVQHPDGWGLALLDQDPICIEKEPKRAVDSSFLKEILARDLETSRCLAHIRKGSIGHVCFNNCHPFLRNDETGRLWIQIHNGTIYDPRELTPYQSVQTGTTDSERVLLHIIDEINKRHRQTHDTADANVRIGILDRIIRSLAPGNKLNLMLYDGDCFYVHKNDPGSLYKREENGTVLFSTQPLEPAAWEDTPLNQLMVYRDGTRIYLGPKHDGTYVHDEEKLRQVYLAYSQL